MKIVLLIISAVFLVCALILFVLHFVINIDIFWFSIPVTCSAVINLIVGIHNLHTKNKQ